MNYKKKLIKAFVKVIGSITKIKRSVVFDSYSGLQYSDNPKAISEELHKIDPTIKIIWNIKDTRTTVPNYVYKVSSPFLFYYEVARCSCFVKNTEYGSQFFKKPGQLFIQTGHGDRPLKKILLETNRNADVQDNRLVDFCIAGSQSGITQYRNGYKYEGKILNIGMPRNDILISENSKKKAEIKKSLGLEDAKKILLYAPTFRDDGSLSSYTVNIERVLDILNIGNDSWVCLVRSHFLSKDSNDIETSEKVINVTNYPDMSDLLLISDYLISDYSSCSGDFIIQKKPVVLALFDYDLYKDNCRDFVCDLNETGFILAKNQTELENIISNYNYQDYYHSYQKVMDYFKINETGTASFIVSNLITNHLNRH